MRKLKVDLERGFIAARGSEIEIATDVLFLISEIHANLARADKDAGELFRRAICSGVCDEDTPVFDGCPSPGRAYVSRERGGSHG